MQGCSRGEIATVNPTYHILLGLAVFFGAVGVDFAHARYVRAMVDNRIYHAAHWSAIQWGASTIGFLVAFKVSLWYLPIEVAGLWWGTVWGANVRTPPVAIVVPEKKVGFRT